MGLKEILIGIVTWIVICIFASVPLTLLLIWKVSVILVAKCFRKDLIPPSAADVMFTTGEGHEKSVVNAGLVCRIEGHIDVDDVRELFKQKFLGNDENSGKPVYERFHCGITQFGGFGFFKRINQINIKDKIVIKNIQDGQILEDLITEWLLTNYAENSPCWEIVIIPMISTNQTALAFKIHHAFADGYSLLYILDQLTENSSPYLVKDFDDSCAQRVSQMLQVPCHLGKMKGPDPSTNPFACEKVYPYQWSMSFTRLDLDMLKMVRRKHNVHFSSIILSILAGSLRRYVLDKKTEADLPSHLFMATTLPWPRHPSKNPDSPTNTRICNHSVTVFFKVPIGNESPLDRLLQVDKSLQEIQNSGLDKFVKLIMIPLLWCFPTFNFTKDLGLGGGYTATLGGNDYKLLGKRMTHINPIFAMQDADPYLSMSTFSFTHSNIYEFTFLAHPQNFPDRVAMEKISKLYIQEELSKLSANDFQRQA